MDVTVFHDRCGDYVSPIVPLPHSEARLTVRVSGKPTRVALRYTTKPFFARENDYTETESVFVGEKNGFALYTALVRLGDEAIRYKFVASCGKSEIATEEFLLVPGYDTPDWSKRCVWYQIMPDSFYNGDLASDKPTGGGVKENAWGNGHFCGEDYYGGDLDGIIKKLDYLQSLGVTAISINPVWTATHQAGYGADDLTDVDACFGGDEALIRLRNETRKRGMRLCLDGVFDYMVYKSKLYNRDGLYPLSGGQKPNEKYYDWFLRDKSGNLIGSFWGHPLMDFSCDAYRDYVYRAHDSVVQTYLRPPYDVDAWRMDVGNIYEGSNPVHFGSAVDIMRDMRKHIHAAGKDKLLITENDLPKMRAYASADSKWNYELGIPLRDFAAGKADAQAFVKAADEALRELPAPMAQSCFNHVTTHDTPRITDTALGNENAAVAATIFNMTYVGAPSIYYGDETGMKAQSYPCMGKAAPASFESMNWNGGDWNLRFFELYTTLGNLRTDRADFFGTAGIETIYAQGDALAFVRFSGDEFCLIACNRGEETKAELDLSAYADNIKLTDLLSGQCATVKGGKLKLSIPNGGAVFCGDGFYEKRVDAKPAAERSPGYDDFTFAAFSCGEGGIYAAQDDVRLVFAASGNVLTLKLGDTVLWEDECGAPVRLQLEKTGARWSACYSSDGKEWRYAAKGVHCNFSEYGIGVCGDATDMLIGDGTSERKRDYKASELSLSADSYAQSALPVRYRAESGDWAYAYGGMEQCSSGASEMDIVGEFVDFKAIFTVQSDCMDESGYVAFKWADNGISVRRNGVEINVNGKKQVFECDTAAGVPLNVASGGGRLRVMLRGKTLTSVPYKSIPCSLSFAGKGKYKLKNVSVYHDGIPWLVGRGAFVPMDEGLDISAAGCEYAYVYALQPITDFVFAANVKMNVSAAAFPDGYIAFNYGVKAGEIPEKRGVSVRIYKDGNRIEALCGENTVASGVIENFDCESFYLALSHENGKLKVYVCPNEFDTECRLVLSADTRMREGGCMIMCAKNARMFVCKAALEKHSRSAENKAIRNAAVAPSKHRYMI